MSNSIFIKMSKLSDIPGEIMVKRGCPPSELSSLSSNNVKPRGNLEKSLPILQNALAIKELTPIQEKFMAALDTGSDVFQVGPEGHGDSFPAYLLPLLGVMIQNEGPSYELATAAPAAVILCPSIKRGIELTSILLEALTTISRLTSRDIPSTRIKLVEYIPDDETHLPDLQLRANGPIDILILSGPAVANLYTSSLGKRLYLNINFQRLRYMVVEELVMSHNSLSDHVVKLLRYMNVIEGGKPKPRRLPREDFQIIFTGSIWNTDTDEMVGLLNTAGRNSVKIFSSPVHILQYKRDTKWKVCHVQGQGQHEKLKVLLELCEAFKEDVTEEKVIVVACGTSELAETVSAYLAREGGFRNILRNKYHETVNGIFTKHHEWLGSIHVVSDDSLEHLNLRNASCLIHFDIAGDQVPSTEPFYQKRYSCVWNRLRKNGDILESPVMSYFFVTGMEENFPALFRFLQTLEKVKMPESLKQVGMEKLLEESQTGPLCTILKCFGVCSAEQCRGRHKISQDDLDQLPDGPSDGGEVAFKVIEAMNPSMYLGRLTKHYVFDENDHRILKKDYKAELKARVEQMGEYFSVTENVKRANMLKTDTIYGLQLMCPTTQSMTYVRVALGNSYQDTKSGALEAFCVDTGITVLAHAKHLLQLPSEFQKWPRHCINIILTNLVPNTFCNNEYTSDAIGAAKSLSEGKTWHGKVLLSMRDTIWINPMVQLVKDPVTGHPALWCNLACEYVNDGYANMLSTHTHMLIMLEHIRLRDPNYPEIVHEFNMDDDENLEEQFYGKVRGDPTEWVSLPVCPETPEEWEELPSPHSMVIQAWVNPWEIYATLAQPESEEVEDVKDDQLLPRLETEMSKWVEETLLPKHYPYQSTITSGFRGDSLDLFGTVVAVKIDNGGWHRALILRKLEEEEEDVTLKFDVFLVDYGTTHFGLIEIEEVVPLLTKFVVALPFQSMCFKLAHIQPPGGNEMTWNISEMSEFTSLMSESSRINVFVIGKAHGTNHPCNYYEAIAFHKLDQNDPTREIGIQLANAGEAKLSPVSEQAFSIIQSLIGETHPNKGEDESDHSDATHDSGDEEIGDNDHGDLEYWENFLNGNEDEVGEPGPPITKFKIGRIDGDDDNEDDEDWHSFVDQDEIMESLLDEEEENVLDGDQENRKDEVDENRNGPESELPLSPEERSAMKKLCQWFLKTL